MTGGRTCGRVNMNASLPVCEPKLMIYSHQDEKRRGSRWKCCFSHTFSFCLCVSVSLPVFFFLFPPDLPPTCLMSFPRVSGLCICTHKTNWERWTVRTHPSEHANTSQSLSVLFLFSFWNLSGSIFASQKQLTLRRQSSLTQTAVSE